MNIKLTDTEREIVLRKATENDTLKIVNIKLGMKSEQVYKIEEFNDILAKGNILSAINFAKCHKLHEITSIDYEILFRTYIDTTPNNKLIVDDFILDLTMQYYPEKTALVKLLYASHEIVLSFADYDKILSFTPSISDFPECKEIITHLVTTLMERVVRYQTRILKNCEEQDRRNIVWFETIISRFEELFDKDDVLYWKVLFSV